MINQPTRLAALSLLAATASLAAAEPRVAALDASGAPGEAAVTTAPPPASDHDPMVTVTTLAPLDVIGVPNATLEFREAPHLGVGITAGFGALAFASDSKLAIVGAQVSYYLERSFSGWNLGAEGLYFYMPSQGGDAFGLGIFGAYAGYKHVGASGFTASLSAGVGAVRFDDFTMPSPIFRCEIGRSF